MLFNDLLKVELYKINHNIPSRRFEKYFLDIWRVIMCDTRDLAGIAVLTLKI